MPTPVAEQQEPGAEDQQDHRQSRLLNGGDPGQGAAPTRPQDGTANPRCLSPRHLSSLVWVAGGSQAVDAGGATVTEPRWTTAGTYHVVRTIWMLVEFWDRMGKSMLG